MNEQEKYDWMVYVSCITFNHASYIKDALNGFTIQETDFPFVCAIIDDASTDGEHDVIKSYLNEYFDLEDRKVARQEETDDYLLTFARHKTNLNCYFAVIFLKYNHYSIKKPKFPYIAEWRDNAKYIAICEGDDYWIAKDKLQKQVVFLDGHPDYSMCFHGSAIKCESDFFSEERKHQFDGLETREYSGEEMVKKWIVPTASMLFRSSIVIPRDSRFLVGDLIIRNQCSIEGRVFCIADKMSVYRLNDGGVTRARPWSNTGKQIEHLEALIDHFPPYRNFYSRLIKKVIFNSLLSRKLVGTITMLAKKPKLLRYLASCQ